MCIRLDKVRGAFPSDEGNVLDDGEGSVEWNTEDVSVSATAM
jgi:hypothetical protein